MRTLKRICVQDHTIIDGDKRLDLKRGEEYITSVERDEKVTVYSTYWAEAPSSLFAGAQVFTQ